MDRDFKIGEREFKLSKINALKQYHVTRRIAPIMSELLPTIAELAKSKKSVDNLTEEDQFDQIAKFAQPIMTGLSKLNDADAEMVLFTLLYAVEIKQTTGNWARVSSGNSLMFDDLDLPLLLNAAGRSLVFNLQGFIHAFQRTS